MLESIYNLEEKRRLVDALLGKANAYLTGDVGPIETARAFSSFRDRDRALDKLLLAFVSVDTQTDQLPIGDVRQHWTRESLKQEDIKIAEAERWSRELVTDACRAIITTLTPLLAELHDQQPNR